MNRSELAKWIYQKSNLKGEFLLRSGQISNQYFDKYLFETEPTILKAIGEFMATLIPGKVDLLAGLEMGGIPIVTILSQISGIPALFIRKEAKKHGTCKLAEGGEVAQRKLLLVEDVVTSGGQIIKSAGDLRALKAEVEDVVCVIDRESGGKENLAKHHLNLIPLFTASELKSSIRS